MIRKVFNVDDYWKVIIYYNVDYNFFDCIAKDIYNITYDEEFIDYIYSNMYFNKAKAVTITSNKYKTSIVLFNKHCKRVDYYNSIIHEAEHIKQHILKYYRIDDSGEDPAYTIGYIASKMLNDIIN